ncbi:MoaF-related domain-containing protein [Bifidobacterium sp.]|jgi:hypothetical protein|uniref:MoaF-related domain-containing protein n=1 Tax=Bifidobacterium sp. TaxID=41200 RepID=UPI0025C3A1AD|nr:hypothetical protein [Bifidobacterium sp.]MCI1634595.1 hypothetical protein [Bifidobacterium sp.]
MELQARHPAIGQTWLADLGPDTPLGHFTVEISFTEDKVSFFVTGGAIKGRSETMDYTCTKLREGLYVVRWAEEAGDYVTHIEDYDEGTCMASSVVGGQFIQLSGTWTRVK